MSECRRLSLELKMPLFNSSPHHLIEISALEGQKKVEQGAALIDVRTAKEFASGHVPGATNIPYDQIGRRISEVSSEKEREIVLYCHLGQRALVAQQTLSKLGYAAVFAAGGLDEWQALEHSES